MPNSIGLKSTYPNRDRIGRLILTCDLDSCIALLGIYLLGYHVLPIQLLDSGPRSRIDSDCRRCCVGLVYLAGCLVSF
jgi:hypothetical protein